MNRALRAATMGALLLAPVTLTACSAGQVNQTTSQVRDKVGPSGEVGDLQLRQIQLANPCESGDEDARAYEEGDNPELILSIANTDLEDDTLTAVRGEAFDGVYVDELPDATSPAPAPTTSAAPSTPAETTGTPAGSETPAATDTPSPSAAPTTAVEPTPTTDLDVAVPGRSVTTIGLRQYEEGEPCEPEIAEDTTRLFLADLSVDEPLRASQTVMVTLTFADAGDVTVPALVAGPFGELERGEAFDFHHEEEGAEGGEEPDTEAE